LCEEALAASRNSRLEREERMLACEIAESMSKWASSEAKIASLSTE
jgi:pantothenate synthetase